MTRTDERIHFPVLYPLIILYLIRNHEVDNVCSHMEELEIKVTSEKIRINKDIIIFKNSAYEELSIGLFAHAQLRKDKLKRVFLFNGSYLGIKLVEKETICPPCSVEFLLSLMYHIGIEKLFIDSEVKKTSTKRRRVKKDIQYLEKKRNIQGLVEILNNTLCKLHASLPHKEEQGAQEEEEYVNPFYEYIRECYKASLTFDYNHQIHENFNDLSFLNNTSEPFFDEIYEKKRQLIDDISYHLFLVVDQGIIYDRKELFDHTKKIDKVLKKQSKIKNSLNTLNDKSRLDKIRKRYVHQLFLIFEQLDLIESKEQLTLIANLRKVYKNRREKKILEFDNFIQQNKDKTLYSVFGIEDSEVAEHNKAVVLDEKFINLFNLIEKKESFDLVELMDDNYDEIEKKSKKVSITIDSSSHYYDYLDEMDLKNLTWNQLCMPQYMQYIQFW